MIFGHRCEWKRSKQEKNTFNFEKCNLHTCTHWNKILIVNSQVKLKQFWTLTDLIESKKWVNNFFQRWLLLLFSCCLWKRLPNIILFMVNSKASYSQFLLCAFISIEFHLLNVDCVRMMQWSERKKCTIITEKRENSLCLHFGWEPIKNRKVRGRTRTVDANRVPHKWV